MGICGGHAGLHQLIVNLPKVMKPVDLRATTILRLFLLAVSIPLAVLTGSGTPWAYDLPQFRSGPFVETPALPPGTTVRLLMDASFAPYSFVSITGAPAGLAVELAFAACAELKLTCEAVPLPFEELDEALARSEGDLIVAGPRIDAATLSAMIMTRPWFRLMGRFAVQSGNPLESADPAALAGKRIGAVEGTTHARWLETYYAEAGIVTFPDEAAAGDALRTGNVDAVFGDNLRLIYWVAGEASAGCCRLLGGAYTDFDHFSRNLAFLADPSRTDLRDAFDLGLDLAQKSGATARVFRAYVPLSPW